MFIEYTPSDDELAMAELVHLLRRNTPEPTNQEELVAKLTHSIRHFDYYYDYSDDGNVWRAGERQKDWINENLKAVEDATIRQHLSSHFNTTDHPNAGSILPYGKYLDRQTEYVVMRWNGKSDDQARLIIGLKKWFGCLSTMAVDSKVQGRVIYSDNIHLANKILRDNLTWFDGVTTLSPATIPNKFWNEICDFSKMYLNRVISYNDLKETMPYSVEVMLTEKAEVLRLGNFYVMFTYAK